MSYHDQEILTTLRSIAVSLESIASSLKPEPVISTPPTPPTPILSIEVFDEVICIPCEHHYQHIHHLEYGKIEIDTGCSQEYCAMR
jgi:hypothetical protein